MLGMKVEKIQGKTKMVRGERCEPKPEIGHLFGGSFYRYFYHSSVDVGHFHMVVQSLSSGFGVNLSEPSTRVIL